MNDCTEKIPSELLTMFSKLEKSILPLEVVIKELGNHYDLDEIEEAIEQLIDSFQIDKVLDYASPEWNLYGGYPIWHLLKLSEKDAEKLRKLKKVQLSLLRLLKNQTESKPFGEMKSQEARKSLQEQGFSEKETEFLFVKDMIDHHYEFIDGKSIEWCRLIPENEKTEEYRREQEKMDREYEEKEAHRMFVADTQDLASEIRRAVRTSPEGISKKDIIKQLFMDDSRYVSEAFAIVLDEDEIIPVTLENGEEGYCVNPDFDEEDW